MSPRKLPRVWQYDANSGSSSLITLQFLRVSFVIDVVLAPVYSPSPSLDSHLITRPPDDDSFTPSTANAYLGLAVGSACQANFPRPGSAVVRQFVPLNGPAPLATSTHLPHSGAAASAGVAATPAVPTAQEPMHPAINMIRLILTPPKVSVSRAQPAISQCG